MRVERMNARMPELAALTSGHSSRFVLRSFVGRNSRFDLGWKVIGHVLDRAGGPCAGAVAGPVVILDGQKDRPRLVAVGDGYGMAEGLGDDVARSARQIAGRLGTGRHGAFLHTIGSNGMGLAIKPALTPCCANMPSGNGGGNEHSGR